MYEYIYEQLKIEFPELVTGATAHIYPSKAPKNVGFDNLIVFTDVGGTVVYHSKMSTIQIACYSKSAFDSVAMSNRVVNIFRNKRVTDGKALKTFVLGTSDMIFDDDTKYYGSYVEVSVQSTKEFV